MVAWELYGRLQGIQNSTIETWGNASTVHWSHPLPVCNYFIECATKTSMNADCVEFASAELLAVAMTHKKAAPSDGQCSAKRSRFKKKVLLLSFLGLYMFIAYCPSVVVFHVRARKPPSQTCAVTYCTDTALPSQKSSSVNIAQSTRVLHRTTIHETGLLTTNVFCHSRNTSPVPFFLAALPALHSSLAQQK
jgi:hypothetical protein